MSVEGFDPLALIPRFGSNVHEYTERGPGKRGCGKMMDLQPINTGDLIGIAQCALIWYGLYTMRAGTRQRDRALDEIIAQGREGREALRKSMQGLDKSMESLDKTLEGLDKSNEGSQRSNESWEKLLEGSQKSNESLEKLLEGSQGSNEALQKSNESLGKYSKIRKDRTNPGRNC